MSINITRHMSLQQLADQFKGYNTDEITKAFNESLHATRIVANEVPKTDQPHWLSIFNAFRKVGYEVPGQLARQMADSVEEAAKLWEKKGSSIDA